jgi:hypothetical protein
MLAAVLMTAPASVDAQATTVTTNIRFPVDFTLTNQCTGEQIAFSGEAHILVQSSATPSGHFKMTIHSNLQDVTGVGLTSGADFHFLSIATTSEESGPGVEVTIPVSFRIIGPGPGNNFLFHDSTHLTVNANGDVTAQVDNFSVTCH